MATHSVFLPGESQGRGSLVGCRLWGRTDSDTTEVYMYVLVNPIVDYPVHRYNCNSLFFLFFLDYSSFFESFLNWLVFYLLQCL